MQEPIAPRHMLLVLLLSGLTAVLLQAPPARAGSETAESVWNEQNALERAKEQVPAGATITGHRCESFGVGFDNTRYRCTVNYTEEAPEPPPSSQP